MTDLLIANALVVDGTGREPLPGAVAVRGDRIERIVRAGEPEPRAAQRIDAAGLVAAPGFIDVHNHSDVIPLVEPAMESMLRQGVTTVIVGNCGSSAFPAAGAGGMGDLAWGVTGDLLIDWDSFDEYLDRIDASRPAVNVAALIGHGTLRTAVMAMERRPPTADEMGKMQRLLADGMEAGAIGLSTGLHYVPGAHATTDEVVELATALRRSGGLYVSHIRGEGDRVFEAVSECIDVGRRSGVPSHVSHLKVETELAWNRAGELLDLIDEARRGGDDVSADQYPYTAWETELSSVLPPWASLDDLGELTAALAPHDRLVRDVEEGLPGWQSSVKGIGWERLVIAAHAPEPGITGHSLAEIAADRGRSPADATFELLLADPHTSLIGHGMIEEDVRRIAAREDVMVGSDGLAVSPEGALGRFNVHPRYYGTFPRVLARYVREEGLLSLQTAVRKMTSLPADRFGLAGRGRIAEGAVADLVVFDPERITDRATFEAPHVFPDGVEKVVVNGRVAWDGFAYGERAGRALRRGV